MIQKLAISFILLCFSIGVKAQKFEGVWLNASKEGRIQIYKSDNKYFGKLVWIKEPNDENGKPKLDKNNPKPNLKNAPLLGLVIIRDMTMSGGALEGGNVYDPKTGKTYKCNIKLDGNDKLELRGFVGISLLGRTETWTRVK